MFTAIARLANTHPRRVLAFAVIIFALAGALGAPVAGLLSNGNDSFLNPDSSSIRATDRIEKVTGQDAVPSIVAVMKTDDALAIAAAASTLRAEKTSLRSWAARAWAKTSCPLTVRKPISPPTIGPAQASRRQRLD